MWWFLAREVLRLRGTIPRDGKWDVVVDLYFYRDPEEVSISKLVIVFINSLKIYYNTSLRLKKKKLLPKKHCLQFPL